MGLKDSLAKKAVLWRLTDLKAKGREVTPDRLVESLSVESLRKTPLPEDIESCVRAFRKLKIVERWALALRMIEGDCCPFCGIGKPEIMVGGSAADVYAVCDNCQAQGPPTRVGGRDDDGTFDLEVEALELWNTRGEQ